MLDKFRIAADFVWDRASKRVLEKVTLNEGDANGRKMRVQVVNNGVVENLTGAGLNLAWVGRLGKGLDNFTVVDAAKGIFELTFKTGMLNNTGSIKASLQLILPSGSGIVESMPFPMDNRPSLVDSDSAQSTDSWTALENALANAENLEAQYTPKLFSLEAQLQQTMKLTFSNIARSRFYQILKSSKVVTFVGDSITAGSSNGGFGWFSNLQQYFTDTNFINKGIGSDTTKKVLFRFNNILNTNADTYVFAIGTNDVRYQDADSALTSTEYVANMQNMVNQIKAKNANAEIIFISAWASFKGDYTSVLDMVDRDKKLDEYNEALHKYASTISAPFIDANFELRKIINFANQSQFLVDYIHPNATVGVELYGNAVLFGDVELEDYNLSKTKTSAKYLYKIVTYDYFEISRLIIGQPAVGAWCNINNMGHDNLSSVIGVSNDNYTLKPKSNVNVPIVLVFTTNTKIKYIQQKQVNSDFSKSINNAFVYYSENPEDILDWDSPTWRLVKTVNKSKYSNVICYFNADITSELALGSGYSYNSGKSPVAVVKDDFIHLDIQLQKSTAWAYNDTLLTLPSAYTPTQAMYATAWSFSTASATGAVPIPIMILNGSIKISMREIANSANDDRIYFNLTYPLPI